jgi:hypothetical protein
MRRIALLCLQVGAWLSLAFALFGFVNSFIRVQETTEQGSSAVGRIIFESLPLLVGGVISWAVLLLAVEAFEQIAAFSKGGQNR